MGPAPRPKRRRQPTIRDVARHALNGSAAVSEGTCAMEELGRTAAREER